MIQVNDHHDRHMKGCDVFNNRPCTCNEIVSDDDLNRAWNSMVEDYRKLALQRLEQVNSRMKRSY